MGGGGIVKRKSIIISFIVLFLIIIGLATFHLLSISKDLSALNGLKGMATICRGSDIVELVGDKSQIVLMSKSNEVGKNAIISSLAERGYKVNERMGASLMCEKNGKIVPIISKMYTKHYILYFLPSEES